MTRKKNKPAQYRKNPRNPASSTPPGAIWLYGLHAVRAALANPSRSVRRAAFTDRSLGELEPLLRRKGLGPEILSPEAFVRLLPPGAVHQGAALLCDPLPARDLEDVLEKSSAPRLVAVLDQITDPQNEGAILRSAAAFGVSAVVVQERHAPAESGALAKAASGALDSIPRVVVVNIARTLEELGRLGFWRIALAADGDAELRDAARPGDIALVLGGEGSGLRRLVRERCDITASIPIKQAMESLNVSNAAAIAFYQLSAL